ncbi:MAG: FAD-dependent monooxygenase [Rhodobacter sp.]|nr:FAD-dependent monooxygenase [Rhodobacter sp.]
MPGDATPLAAIFWSLPAGAHDAWCNAPLEQWKTEATALWPAFAPFLGSIRRHDQMTMARYTHGTLRNPASGGMAHIGDAAHRASPQLGQGANMALLDAYALWSALARHSLDDALRAYVKGRRWHVAAYQALSAVFTPQYQSDSRVLPWLRDRVLMPVSKIPPVPRVLSRIVCGDLLPPYGSIGMR